MSTRPMGGFPPLKKKDDKENELNSKASKNRSFSGNIVNINNILQTNKDKKDFISFD